MVRSGVLGNPGSWDIPRTNRRLYLRQAEPSDDRSEGIVAAHSTRLAALWRRAASSPVAPSLDRRSFWPRRRHANQLRAGGPARRAFDQAQLVAEIREPSRCPKPDDDGRQPRTRPTARRSSMAGLQPSASPLWLVQKALQPRGRTPGTPRKREQPQRLCLRRCRGLWYGPSARLLCIQVLRSK
jgi:hypothetical protein